MFLVTKTFNYYDNFMKCISYSGNLETHKQVNYTKHNLVAHIEIITATQEDGECNIWKGGRIVDFCLPISDNKDFIVISFCMLILNRNSLIILLWKCGKLCITEVK